MLPSSKAAIERKENTSTDNQKKEPTLEKPPRTVRIDTINRMYDILTRLSDQPFDGNTAGAILQLRQWMLPYRTRFVVGRTAFIEKYAKKSGDGKWILSIKEASTLEACMNEIGSPLVTLKSELVGILTAEKLYSAKSITANELEILNALF